MKIAKRILAIALVVMLMAAMFVPASAAGTGKTITINNVAAGHSFEAYQIFTGDLAGSVLSNIRWGDGVDSTKLLAELQKHTKYGTQFTACKTAEDVATVMEDKAWTAADTDQFAKLVSNCLSTTKFTSTAAGNGSYNIIVPIGYFFVKDVTETLGPDDAYTKYIIHVTTNVAVSAKSDSPTVVNQVSLSKDNGYTEAVSASVSDYVYFKLTANLKARTNDYGEYHIEFVDTLPAGLTYDGLVSVSVSGHELTDAQKTDYGFSESQNGNVITYVLDETKTAVTALTNAAVTANDTVTVVFKAKVNQNILVNAKEGNTDSVVLWYSNNPNAANYATALGKTSPATSKVFSYGIVIDKIDSADATKKLEGAEFKLYRNVNGTNQYAIATPVSGTEETTNVFIVTGWDTDETKGSTFTTNKKGAFSVEGLGKNTYYLKEITAPAGYNSIKEAIEISFVASFNLSSGTVTGFTASVTGHGAADLACVNEAEGLVTVTVKNNQGATLPETGGIGTPIFYVIGIVLVAAAAAVLFARKRKGAEG